MDVLTVSVSGALLNYILLLRWCLCPEIFHNYHKTLFLVPTREYSSAYEYFFLYTGSWSYCRCTEQIQREMVVENICRLFLF